MPNDVFTNYIHKDSNFILVKDPKHSSTSFHFTIWSVHEIETIKDVNEKIIKNLEIFIKIVKKLNLYKNEKIYFTYPPTHNRLHCHIVPNMYISYRPEDELYNFCLINKILQNIKIINDSNTQKLNASKLELKFDIGIVILQNFDSLILKIKKIKHFKESNNLDYIILKRSLNDDNLIEYLLNNCNFINKHIIGIHNYEKMLKYDKIIYI